MRSAPIRCLLIGRCIEVWSVPEGTADFASARNRHDLARRYWLALAGLERLADQ